MQKKRIVSMFMAGLMTLSLFGCGSASQPAADTGSAPEPAKQEATTEAKTEEKKSDKKSGKATITVTSGMSSEDVSQLLENAGLVKSATEFNTWLIQKGYDSQLHIGEFEIESGASNEEIAKTLMTQGK